MLDRTISAIIAIATAAVIGYGAADIPANADLSTFDVAAFATFAVAALVKIVWPASRFAVTGDAE